MKVIDLIEKISRKNKHDLDLHKDYFLSLIQKDLDIEFKWHLVQIIPRLNLTPQELENVWNFLTEILKNKKESRIVRAFSITTTEELFQIDKIKYKKFKQLLANVQKENIPSLNSKIKKILNS
ncbi:hypothetical protein IPJ91_00405 [bacterium]|nr:MAG: hypothetical protein IPJ91_00405 [bacterium]